MYNGEPSENSELIETDNYSETFSDTKVTVKSWGSAAEEESQKHHNVKNSCRTKYIPQRALARMIFVQWRF